MTGFQYRKECNSGNTRASATGAREAGFSLIEIIIVLGILGGLVAVLIGGLGSGGDTAKKKETGVRAGSTTQNLLRFQADVGRMPTTDQGIAALFANPGNAKWSGPYGDPEDAKDGWGSSFTYELTAKGPKLVSPGADGEPDNEDDLTYISGRLVDSSEEKPVSFEMEMSPVAEPEPRAGK